MKKILTGALAALTLGGGLAAASSVPASAAPWHGGYHGGGYHGGGYYRGGGYRGGGWGGAAVAGIVGLAAGAAIANSYDRPYYGYGYGYAPGYYGYGGPRCRIENRWNPAWRGYDRVRVCY